MFETAVPANLDGAPAARRGRFSPFRASDQIAAATLEIRMRAASEEGTTDADKLSAAVAVAEAAVGEGRPQLAQSALSRFAMHSPLGRRLQLPRPIEAIPEILLSQRVLESTIAVDVAAYWREDPLANEHHFHWHIVYPAMGLQREDIPQELIDRVNGGEPLLSLTEAELNQIFRYQDRHGEMFVYMHQQMLARYEAERLSLGLPRLAPLPLDGSAIAEGYDVITAMEFGPGSLDGFQDRPEGETMRDPERAALAASKAAIEQAIDDGFFVTPAGEQVALTADILGSNIEAAFFIFRHGVSGQDYGNLHNAGHNALAVLPLDPGNEDQQIYGVMADPIAAIRDPVFWRWHKIIDDLSYRWQSTRPALAFDDLPAAQFEPFAGGSAIALIPADAAGEPDSPERAALGTAAGADWAGFTASHGQDGLRTEMKQANVALPGGGTLGVQYLTHQPFAYAVRLHNPSADAVRTTLRLFLAPTAWAEDRRAWIEMDKVLLELGPGEHRVLIRSGAESEVIKKPVDLAPDNFIPAEDQDARCACGWPFTLLLPRGTTAGLDCTIFAMLTDAAEDGFTQVKTCGSVSFCGALDTDYMDRREMGYPFHRDWAKGIAETAAEHPQMTTRSVTIKHG